MKTIFQRFVYLYVLIFLISFIVILIGIRLVLDYYFVNHETDQIVQRVRNYEKILNSAEYIDRISLELIEEQVLLLDGYTGAYIWLATERGELYGTRRHPLGEEQLVETSLQEDLQKVFQGDIVKREVYYDDLSSTKMLRIGIPFEVSGILYAMVVNLPMPEIEETIAKVSVIVFVSLSLSAVVAVLIIFGMTDRMSREINLLSKSANQISSGSLDRRIKIERHDELGELAVAFNKMAEGLENQERVRKNFISNLSHDIRTPLTTIKGYINGVLDGTIDDSKKDRYLGIASLECDRLLDMSNNLLDLARIESGELILNRTDFDINQMILEVLDSFETKIIEKKVKLSVDLEHGQLQVHADIAAIQRVVYNLLDNATKFIDHDGTLSIRSEIRGKKCYVGISNTGTVLSEDEQENIWNRFSKLDKSRGLDKKSSGLGLSIVREIVKAHDETIDVYSNEEVGVAFIFTLPVQFFGRKEGESL